MSVLPSPLKSPTLTSTHVSLGFQVAHNVAVKEVTPSERPTHHCPDSSTRPAMSVLPSPLKSPTFASTQVTFGFQAAHKEVLKLLPRDSPTHHWPPCKVRPTMSAFPSPLKSATLTSSHITVGLQLAHTLLVNEVPVLWPTHH